MQARRGQVMRGSPLRSAMAGLSLTLSVAGNFTEASATGVQSSVALNWVGRSQGMAQVTAGLNTTE